MKTRYLEKFLRRWGIPDRNFIQNVMDTQMHLAILSQYAVRSCELGIWNDSYDFQLPDSTGPKVVVSLTTYSKRIYDVYLTIESIFQQTIKPNRVILWLDEAEFNDDNLPLVLKSQQERGLTIGYCPNIKSYKKLIPTLRQCPDDIIITIDDDTIYPQDLLERLLNAYRQAPNYIYFTRGCMMAIDKQGKPLPYRKWNRLANNVAMDKWSAFTPLSNGTHLALPTGVGGILYPPHSLHEDVFREDLFMTLCPKADDIWFKIMAFKQGTIARLVYFEKPFSMNFLTIPDSQEMALSRTNLKHSENDPQLQNVLEHYNINFMK